MRNIVKVKDVLIGGNNKVVIQSMTNTKTSNFQKTLEQIFELDKVGCEIVRVAIENNEDIKSLHKICKESPIPVVADIQYSYKHALDAIKAGAHKIRINPSYLDETELSLICKELKFTGIPVRVGVNEGSTLKDSTPERLAEIAINNAKLLQKHGVENIVIAAKTSSVKKTIETNRILYNETSFPIHLGLTEAGTEIGGLDKSFVTLGGLLVDGIGDTIRVSLSANPVKEVLAAKRLLRACNIDKDYANIISCPTCGRTKIDVFGLAKAVEDYTKDIEIPLKIAIMGCAVNGIGESKGADLGVCGGKNISSIFVDGKIVKTISNENILPELFNIIELKTKTIDE
ncbi:MAG TPA: flavodoxin-dependent (E)-4-hydroxy-3-methylbut-2-enyl-diphosphate synthase [Clostridiales bacterium]|nr:flavodoxin-dependent (E)-4-hydroxy-3-methylbut-2-enyl-diphosphate synthase [Clostridiales bacterium]